MSENYEIQRVRVNRNAWRASLTREIIHLEDNLDQIYHTAGLKSFRIVKEGEDEQDAIIQNGNGTSRIRDYESIIAEQVGEIRQAVDNICGLISSVTEFELPIPVLVLLRLAQRIILIRCQDFKKSTGLAKAFVVKNSHLLIAAGLNLYEWISTVMSTNILPFQSFINNNLLGLLAWTRSSNLRDYNEEQYNSVRLQTLSILTSMIERLSLNLNLDPKQLTSLVEDELINGLELAAVDLACASIRCLDRLYVSYGRIMSSTLDYQIKNFVIQTCIATFTNPDRNTIDVKCKRQLLYLLENIANSPYATSTTELAWHVFELCERFENDPELRYIARRSIKVGLAHRPTIVSNFDVYDCYARKCGVDVTESQPTKKADDSIKPEEAVDNAGNVAEDVGEVAGDAGEMVEDAGGTPDDADEPFEDADEANKDADEPIEDAGKAVENADEGSNGQGYLDLFVE